MIGVAADRRLGANHDNLLILRSSGSRFRSGFNHSNHGHMRCRRDLVERQRRRSIAGDDQHLRAMGFKIVRRLDRIAGHGLNRFRAVGQTGGIAKVGVFSVRNELK